MFKAILFLSVLAGSAAGAILPATKTGHPFNVLSGGRFSGTLDGDDVSFWCVDQQLTIPGGYVEFQASVAALEDAAGSPLYDVRYEDATFINSIGGNTDDAVFRYRMAAWLVLQYDEAAGAGNGKNKAIQRAIWKATDTTHGGDQSSSLNTVFDGTDYFSQAINFVTLNPNFEQFGFFRVVSGFQSGNANYLRDVTSGAGGGKQYQTFLTYSREFGIEEVPEPGAWMLIGCGLLGIGMYRRRR